MKIIRKIISISIILTTILSVAFVIVSAADCSHRSGFKRYSAKEPTCTENGNSFYKICKDNDCVLDSNNNVIDMEDVIIPALGHTEVTVHGY